MATKTKQNTNAAAQEQAALDGQDNPATEGPRAKGGVKLRVTTRLERHVRAGIVFRKGETEVVVSPKQAERLKADKHLQVEPA